MVFEVLQILDGPAAWRVVEAPKGINSRQWRLLGFFLRSGCFYVGRGKPAKFEPYLDEQPLDPEADRDDQMVSEAYGIAADYIPRITEEELVCSRPICGDDNLRDYVADGDAGRIRIGSLASKWITFPCMDEDFSGLYENTEEGQDDGEEAPSPS